MSIIETNATFDQLDEDISTSEQLMEILSNTREQGQVMKALIKVRKDMGRLIESNKFSEMSREDMQREYRYIYEDLTDLLEQQNIDAYKSEPGDDLNKGFDWKKHSKIFFNK